MNEVSCIILAELDAAWKEKGEEPLEALPITQHSWDLGGGGSFPNDSHLSKLWMMQPQHSPFPASHRGWRKGGGYGNVSVRGHVT